MPAAGTERRLAAIMFTDIVGYTALMAESEAKGLRVRERHRMGRSLRCTPNSSKQRGGIPCLSIRLLFLR